MKSPRVAIDVTAAVTQRAGVGRYVRELTIALAAMPDGPDLLPFFVAPGIQQPLDVSPVPVGLQRAVRTWRFEVLARHMMRYTVRGPWDSAQVYHATDVVFPPVQRRLPIVATVHDLSYVILPQYHTRLNGGYLRMLTPTLMRKSRAIVAVSHSTARDLIERMHVPEQKIHVVYQGVAATFKLMPAADRITDIRRRYDLPESFILSVGTLEPRKNLSGTLKAYSVLRNRLADAPPLALVGGSGWRLNEQDLVAKGDSAHVRRLGYVPDEDLAALYASCSVFVYPSLHEGWGLPVAEALSMGAPTVTSNCSSLPEVAGDAALLVDPNRPDEIAAALEQVLTDSGLAARLHEAGPVQAARFSTEEWAAGTLRVYREVAQT